jgi:hypothetical protein
MLKTPLSRAEYDILRLADQPIGYDPYEDGPWWVRLLQPFAFSVIRGLVRNQLLWVSREPSGRLLIRATERGVARADEEDLNAGDMPPLRIVKPWQRACHTSQADTMTVLYKHLAASSASGRQR